MQYVSYEDWNNSNRLICLRVDANPPVAALALFACGAVAEEEAAEHSSNLEEMGFYYRNVPLGLSVWEGKWMPMPPDHEGASDDCRPKGTFRDLVPDELKHVLKGESPWEKANVVADQIVCSGGKLGPHDYDYLQGMGSVVVKPGETKSLQVVVGENFSLEMISLVDSMWLRFEVVGLEVDGLTPPWAIFPYRVVGDTTVNPPLNLCKGQVVKLSARNVSESSQPFVAGLFGPVSGQKTE